MHCNESNDMHAATTNYNLRIECMTEVELWRNYQIYKNWLKVVGDKRFVKATETELKSLNFGCTVKKQLKNLLQAHDVNIPL